MGSGGGGVEGSDRQSSVSVDLPAHKAEKRPDAICILAAPALDADSSLSHLTHTHVRGRRRERLEPRWQGEENTKRKRHEYQFAEGERGRKREKTCEGQEGGDKASRIRYVLSVESIPAAHAQQ